MSGRDLFGRPLPTGSMSSGSSSSQPPRPPPAASSSRAVSTPLDPAMDGRLSAFRQLKPSCVQLMGLASQPPTQTSAHAAVLSRIRQICETLPAAAFSPSLINYVVFPLTSILRQCGDPAALPDGFLEAAFGLLALVVRRWQAAPGGMEPAAWEQLWRFAVSAIGPRVSKTAHPEHASQETALAAINTLSALTDAPTPAMRQKAADPRALMPTLFQTITVALDCSDPAPPNSALQRAAVQLLRTCIGYLGGQGNVLASVLPGVVSAMAKAIIGGKNVRGDAAAAMAGAVQDVVVETLADGELRRLGVLAPRYDDLAGLAGAWNAEAEKMEQDDGAVDDHDAPQPEQGDRPEPFPPLTAKYVQFTGAQLQGTLPPLLAALGAHTSPLAREAAASLAGALVSQCRESLPRLVPASLSALLLLSTDAFDSVRRAAEARLAALLAQEAPALENALVDILSGAVNALPRAIRAGDERRTDETARLVAAVAQLTSSLGPGRFNAIAAFLGPAGAVERWSWALLECLEFGRPAGWSAADGGAARTAALGWSGGMVTASLPLLTDGGASPSGSTAPDAPFPPLPLRFVQSPAVVRQLGAMLTSLGGAGGEAALHSVQYFVRFAGGNRARAPAKAASAVWVADSLLQGIASRDAGGRAPKSVRKAARDVARALVDMDEEDEDAPSDAPPESSESSEVLAPERKTGLDELSTLLDRPMANASASAETSRLAARAQRVVLQCMALRAVSTSAAVLGTGFRPLLLHVLYAVLAHLSSAHDLVRAHAEAALARIAWEAGYASAQNMVLDNVDYVVNAVSQRLTYHRLSAHAPLVLIAVIRLVGAALVPMVHDIVDEIFDALDDFHGYAALASALLAVLNTLVASMADDPPAASAQTKEDQEELRRFLRPPDPAADFAQFAAWWDGRGERAQDDIEGILARAPEHGWGKHDPANEGKEEQEEAQEPEPEEIPPTRQEELGAAILAKAAYYLSHASPFLRARVLALMSSTVAVLASRPSALLPEIDRAWPTILTRLSDPAPYVAVEAAELVRTLCAHVPSYISRRVADAWPTLRRLLRSQMEADRRSDLANRRVFGAIDRHSTSHRLYAALLGVARFVVARVPVKDAVLWDVACAFRAFLDARVAPALQAAAVELYAALNARDGDLAWTVLCASSGRLQGDNGTWAYLRDEALDLEQNVAAVLDQPRAERAAPAEPVEEDAPMQQPQARELSPD